MKQLMADTSTFHLHQKNVPALDDAALMALPNRDPTVRQRMIEAHEFLHNVDLYKQNLPKRTADGCTSSSVRDDFIAQLEESGSIKQVPRSSVKGWVNFFTVIEFFKKRFRPIRETVDINKTWGKETLQNISFPSKSDICNLVLEGSHFAAFDMAAYYDQFAYKNGIPEYLCFRKNGKYYSTQRLCMGQRHGCQIAQTTTLFLLDFPTRRCKIAYAYIDNVIFVGSPEDVKHDSLEFIRRCKIANITLNEASVLETSGVDACIMTSGEWCGVHLDFENKQVKLIGKTVQKLTMSWMNRQNWTYRQFAAHVGLCFWTWGILDIPLYSFYSLLKYISTTSRLLQGDESLWDTPCKIFPSALPALQKWTDLCLANAPRKVKKSSDPVVFVTTDASHHGWGYRAFIYATGEIRTFGDKWSRAQLDLMFPDGDRDKMRHSVYAEPLAIYNSLCHLLNKSAPSELRFAKESDDICPPPPYDVRMKIGVATDNSSAMHTMNRGFASRSYDINQSIARLREAFPESDFDIDISFIPGHMNPADKPSRGKLDVNADNGHNIDYENLRRFADKFSGNVPANVVSVE